MASDIYGLLAPGTSGGPSVLPAALQAMMLSANVKPHVSRSMGYVPAVKGQVPLARIVICSDDGPARPSRVGPCSDHLNLSQPANTLLDYCTFNCTFTHSPRYFSTELHTLSNWVFDVSFLLSIPQTTDYESPALTD